MGEKSREKSRGNKLEEKLGVKSEKCGVHRSGGKSWRRKVRGKAGGKIGGGNWGKSRGKNWGKVEGKKRGKPQTVIKPKTPRTF